MSNSAARPLRESPLIHVLLPFMALALYGVMRKIDRSYLRAAGLESDPVIAVVPTLLSGAALVGVLIPLAAESENRPCDLIRW
jgi:hypothetical protein